MVGRQAVRQAVWLVKGTAVGEPHGGRVYLAIITMFISLIFHPEGF